MTGDNSIGVLRIWKNDTTSPYVAPEGRSPYPRISNAEVFYQRGIAMEFPIYFSVFVICMSTLHLISQLAASAHLSHPYTSASLQTTKRTMELRDDWYMFFYCSTLTGQRHKVKHQNTAASSYQQRVPSRLASRTYVH